MTNAIRVPMPRILGQPIGPIEDVVVGRFRDDRIAVKGDAVVLEDHAAEILDLQLAGRDLGPLLPLPGAIRLHPPADARPTTSVNHINSRREKRITSTPTFPRPVINAPNATLRQIAAAQR